MLKKYGWIALVVLLSDRAAKIMMVSIPEEGMTLIPGIIGLRPAWNTGMAFSMLSGKPWLLALLSLMILGGAAWFLRGKALSRLASVGLMMMFGGAIGNLADRMLAGAVPDMIELLFVRFAIFNVADACLVVGCGLVMISLFTREENTKEKE